MIEIYNNNYVIQEVLINKMFESDDENIKELEEKKEELNNQIKEIQSEKLKFDNKNNKIIEDKEREIDILRGDKELKIEGMMLDFENQKKDIINVNRSNYIIYNNDGTQSFNQQSYDRDMNSNKKNIEFNKKLSDQFNLKLKQEERRFELKIEEKERELSRLKEEIEGKIESEFDNQIDILNDQINDINSQIKTDSKEELLRDFSSEMDKKKLDYIFIRDRNEISIFVMKKTNEGNHIKDFEELKDTIMMFDNYNQNTYNIELVDDQNNFKKYFSLVFKSDDDLKENLKNRNFDNEKNINLFFSHEKKLSDLFSENEKYIDQNVVYFSSILGLNLINFKIKNISDIREKITRLQKNYEDVKEFISFIDIEMSNNPTGHLTYQTETQNNKGNENGGEEDELCI